MPILGVLSSQNKRPASPDPGKIGIRRLTGGIRFDQAVYPEPTSRFDKSDP